MTMPMSLGGVHIQGAESESKVGITVPQHPGGKNEYGCKSEKEVKK